MAFHVNLEQAPTRAMREGRGTIHLLVDQERGGSRNMDVHVNVLQPGSGPGPYHYHSNSDNLYFILEGQARVLIEGRAIEAGPGEAVTSIPFLLFLVVGLLREKSQAARATRG